MDRYVITFRDRSILVSVITSFATVYQGFLLRIVCRKFRKYRRPAVEFS